MNGIVCATFPRSGNTFLVNSLSAELGDNLKFCESHLQKFEKTKHNFVKTHDFNLNFEVPLWWRVVVQLRDPLDAIPSWFDVELKAGAAKDTAEEWEAFYRRSIPYYREFVRKWRPRADLLLQHETFMQHPTAGVELVAEMLGHPIEITEPLTPRTATRAEGFRYYDRKTFTKIKMLCEL